MSLVLRRESWLYIHRHLGSVEKNKDPPPPPTFTPINFCVLAFFDLKYDILYAWSYTSVRKNDLEHMENIWKNAYCSRW